MDSTDKGRIDKLIPLAYTVINEKGIAQGGAVKKTWVGQVSSFGAAITMGSLQSAVAFFSNPSKGDVDRTLLLKAIGVLLEKGLGYKPVVWEDISSAGPTIQRDVMNCAIALKLAMNFYRLDTSDDDQQ